MRPARDPLRNLIYTAADRAVRDVYVDGVRVVADGEVTTIDVPGALAFFGGSAALIYYLDRPRIWRLVLLAVVLGLAQVVKLYCLLLYPVSVAAKARHRARAIVGRLNRGSLTPIEGARGILVAASESRRLRAHRRGARGILVEIVGSNRGARLELPNRRVPGELGRDSGPRRARLYFQAFSARTGLDWGR